MPDLEKLRWCVFSDDTITTYCKGFVLFGFDAKYLYYMMTTGYMKDTWNCFDKKNQWYPHTLDICDLINDYSITIFANVIKTSINSKYIKEDPDIDIYHIFENSLMKSGGDKFRLVKYEDIIKPEMRKTLIDYKSEFDPKVSRIFANYLNDKI